MKRKIINILALVVGVVAIERFCYWQTAGFRVDKLRSDFVYESGSYEASCANPKLLEQTFTLFGSGVQCYAFLGSDGSTVLKVFKHYHNLPVQGFLRRVHLPGGLEKWRDNLVKRREKRLQSIFSSCEIAFQELKEETGLIYLHLQKTSDLRRSVTLVDKLGIAHSIDLDTTAFVLQKKVEMLTEKFDLLVKNQKREEVEKCLTSLTSLIAERCKKGYANHDLRIERNIGFAKNQAIEIDIGSFKKTKPKKSRAMRKELLKLKRWIAENYPEFSHHVEQEIKSYI